jgi:hypothetical protein
MPVNPTITPMSLISGPDQDAPATAHRWCQGLKSAQLQCVSASQK